MPEQAHEDATSPERGLPWWVRLCRWLWKVFAFLGTVVIVGVIINVASTWLTNPSGITADSPLNQLLAHWPIVLLIGCCLLLLALLTWLLSRWQTHPSVTPSLAQQNRVRMIGRLRRSYRDMLAQTLQGNAWMDMHLSEKPSAVQNAATLLLRSANQQEHLLPAGTSILGAYDLAEQNLLILGAPGAGKSTLLLELAQQLTERAAGDTGHPLPVILPLSSWAVKRPPLQNWIVEQLTQIYTIPRRVSEHWVQGDVILPLLDGLDEMDETARPICIERINAYHRDHLQPLVVCSRTNEYETATRLERLRLDAAVVVQPLTSQQVDAHLLQAGKAVAALRSAIKKNLALQELATTPLMLSVLMLAYQGTTVRELPTKGAVLQRQVWTDYVARMVQRKGNEARYPLERTLRWLTYLAQQMRVHQQTIFYAEYLQADWLTCDQQQIIEWLAIRVPAIVLGVCVGLLVSLFLQESNEPVFLLQRGLLGGFVGGCVSQQVLIDRTHFNNPLSTGKLAHFRNALLLGVLVASSNGLALSPGVYGLSDWARDGSILGLGSGLSAWIFQTFLLRSARKRISVSSSRPPRRWGVPVWLTTNLPQGIWLATLLFGLVMWLSHGLSHGLIRGSSRVLFYTIDYELNFAPTNELSVVLSVVLISIILNVSLNSLRFAEHIRWRWYRFLRPRHLLTSVIVICLIFCFVWLSYMLTFGLGLWVAPETIFQLGGALANAWSIALANALSLGLTYWLLLGLYQGMVQEHVEDQDRYQFNQGIRHSLRNGTLVSLISACIIVGVEVFNSVLNNVLNLVNRDVWLLIQKYSVSYWMEDVLFYYLSSEWRTWLSDGLSVVWLLAISGFLLILAMSGGLTILRHYVIRWLLAQSQTFPLRAQAFLDDATARILLRRVGGGYSFSHRLLLDYFADLDQTGAVATSPTPVSTASTTLAPPSEPSA